MKKLPHFYFVLAGLVFFAGNLFAQKLPSGPQVLTFHSEADDTEQPYAIYIPKDFDEEKEYPFVMMLHGAGSNHRLALKRVFGKSNKPGETDVEASRYFQPWEDVDYIVVAPYARGTAGYQGIPEMDVYAVIDDVKKRFKIDENKMYLTGLSMGGGGTLWIGLSRPDIWAAIAPVCPAPPQGTRELAGNAFNLPVYFFHGDADPVVPVTGSREWLNEMKELGVDVQLKEFPGVQHDSWVNAYEGGRIFNWFEKFERNPYPEKVRFATHQLKYNKAYWVLLDQIHPGKVAKVEANIGNNNLLEIQTENLLAFTLNIDGHPQFDTKKPSKINIDGKSLELNSGGELSFHQEQGQWKQRRVNLDSDSKQKGKEGPIFNAFAGRHVYVYGTEGNPSEEELAKRRDVATEAANWSAYRGEFMGRILFFPRVVADNEVRPSDLEEANLILFGTKETNKWIREFEADLPMHLTADDNTHGLFYIYPKNGRYVAINSGLPWWENGQGQEFSFISQVHRQLPVFKDFLLFKGSTANILAEGYFGNQWEIQDSDLVVLEKTGVIQLK